MWLRPPKEEKPPYPFPREYSFPPFFTLQPNEATRHAQLTKWGTIVLGYCAHHGLWKLQLSEAVVERHLVTAQQTTAATSAGLPGVDGTTTEDDMVAEFLLATNNNSNNSGQRPPSDLFHNRKLDRRLSLATARAVMDHMCREGTAERVDDAKAKSMLASLGLLAASATSSSSASAGAGAGDSFWIWWRPIGEWADKLMSWVEDTGQKGSVLTLREISVGPATRTTEFAGMPMDVLRRVLAVLVKKGKAQVFGAEEHLGVKFF